MKTLTLLALAAIVVSTFGACAKKQETYGSGTYSSQTSRSSYSK